METLQTTRVRWLLVFWLFVLSAVSYLDRVNISVSGSSIATAYSITDIQLGWVFSAFLLGYALFQTPGGWLADRLGSRRVLTAGVFWWGVFTALVAAVPSKAGQALLTFILLRFLLGAGEAIIYPASNQFVSRWIPTHERGLANGWIFAGVGAGAGVTPPLITYIMSHWGWRSAFAICALIGVIVGIVWYLIARDTPEQHPRVSPPELAIIHAGLTVHPSISASCQRSAQSLLPWRTILASREVWAITLSYFSYGYVAWIFFSWFYIYLAKVRGLNLKASAFYAMLPFLAMAVCCPLGGVISDRLTKRRGKRLGRCGVALCAMVLAAAFVAFGSTAKGSAAASIVLACGAGALYLAQSSFWSVAADIAGASSGSVSGMMNTGGQMGGVVTASLTPVIASGYGWTASFLVAAGLCGLGALAWLFVDPELTIAPVPSAVGQPESIV